MLEKTFGFQGAQLDQEHADRLERMYELMRSRTGIGAGIDMFTQFHFYDQMESDFDSALHNDVNRDGGSRHVAPFHIWEHSRRYKSP